MNKTLFLLEGNKNLADKLYEATKGGKSSSKAYILMAGIPEMEAGKVTVEGGKVFVDMYQADLFNNDDIEDSNLWENPKTLKKAIDYVKRVFKRTPKVKADMFASRNSEYEYGYIMFYDPKKLVRVKNSYTPKSLEKDLEDGTLQLNRTGNKISWEKNPKVSGWNAPEEE